MKLRNKKTGEIGYFCFANWNDPILIILDKNGVQLAKYNSLAELNADWEDAPEEPKEYWYIDWTPEIGVYHTRDVASDADERQKEIGNYFETKKEAEKAVEKLKALKRLKDNGFSFNDWNWKTQCIGYNLDYTDITEEQIEEAEKDLDLLFCPEEKNEI